MREIKFRLVKDGKIVGYERHDIEHYSKVTICHSEDGEKWFSIVYCAVEREFIEHDHKDQFIGLPDKNGVEIYERDIIRGSRFPHHVHQVEYDEAQFNPFGYPSGWSDGEWENVGWLECEVIGNIYENKELSEMA